eukprot:CAMPEP_0195125756 /NCGR_PEP_ID=MMETSP0448-20130528/133564_1 /TAXON_ID=66468 /ORGANISM="Heterocapsa triquestra, Strain CCMP 448" /LENGTH=358 /DNA_ID=CAMNT_0040163409 /DNA_START=42 /DNA_END=1115 /DNA_ORIENTATION=-
MATCPHGVWPDGEPLQLTEPTCSCPDPAQWPGPAYLQRPNGDWHCAPGTIGTAFKTCRGIGGVNCTDEPMILGCELLRPCVLPQVDPCKMDISDCVSHNGLPSDQELCRVHCLPPYMGGTTVASCPLDNIDPDRNITWEEPQCVIRCAEPDPMPVGYVKTDLGYECAPSFRGIPDFAYAVNVSCGVDAECNPTEAVLDGCVPALQPCLGAPGADPCIVNSTDCANVTPGGACQIHCQAPYSGVSVNAICAADNTDPQGLQWEHPHCFLDVCIDVPEWLATFYPGYAKDSQGNWQCAEGWQGTVTSRCSHWNNCFPVRELRGCAPEVHCIVPSMDKCMFDTAECWNLEAGRSCTLGCKE